MDRFFSSLYRLSILCMVVFSAGSVVAAIPEASIRSMAPGKLIFISEGAFVGGEADRPLSLLDLKVLRSKTGSRERMELQFSDQQGQPLRDRIGYVHVAVEKDPARVVIDLSQVHRTSIDGESLQKFFARSKNIRQAVMTMDPEDHSTNITLLLNEPKAVAVTTKPNELGHLRLLVDIRPLARQVKK